MVMRQHEIICVRKALRDCFVIQKGRSQHRFSSCDRLPEACIKIGQQPVAQRYRGADMGQHLRMGPWLGDRPVIVPAVDHEAWVKNAVLDPAQQQFAVRLRPGETAHIMPDIGDIRTIYYNFMPVLDWTRIALRHRLPDGAECLRFDHVDLAIFDLFILRRPSAGDAYTAPVHAEAARRFAKMDQEGRDKLADTFIAGLPGSEESYALDKFNTKIAAYADMDAAKLRGNLVAFLKRVMPVLVPQGVRLAIHPDDPPRPILGLPRIVSTAEDTQAIFEIYDTPENGLTFCTGSLGVRKDNDLLKMLARFGERVHFLHLRNTRRDLLSDISTGLEGESFEEAAHVDAHTDMVRLIAEILNREALTGAPIPFRPDHGHALQSDLRSEYRPG